MQQVTTNSNHSIQIPGSKEIASMRVVQSCGCGSPKLYVRYKGETQYVPLKICAAPSSPGLNNRYVDVFSDQTVNGVKSFADYIRVSSSYIKGGATQIFGNTAGGGLFNVLIGTGAGNAMTGQKNIMIGDNAGVAARAINNTIAIGVQSGPATNYLGDNNFFLGYKAGYNMTGGSGNVHIGQGSGISGTYSNRLFIGNPGEPTTLESAHIITGYFDTGVLRFPKGYANTDASKFLTTGSDGTLVLSAPKMPTDYISNNPVNTLPRDNTQNHGITDANLIQQSLTYWNNSTKTNTPAGFDQGIGITGISPDGTQAGQVVLDKTANALSFRGKATNVWKAWRTVETTDNKVTNLDSPNNTTYPTTLLLNSVKDTIRTSWSSTNINNNKPPQYCKIMSISFTANVFNSFEGVYEVTGFHGSNAGQDFAGQIYIFCGGGTTNNNTISAFFKKNPFSKNSFSFYYVYDSDNYIFDIYIGISNQYIRAKFSETEKPSLSVNSVTCTYLDNNGLVSSMPTGAIEFSNYDMVSKFDAVVLDWNAKNNTSANYTGDLNSINSISYFGFNQNALNRPGFFPYGGTLLNMSLNTSTSTQLALGWTGGTGGDYFGYRTKNNGVFSDWYQVASRDWVTSQIPVTPTLQQVTAAGNTSNNSISVTGGTGGSLVTLGNLNVDFYPGTNTSWARGLRLLDSTSAAVGGIGFFGNTGSQILSYGYLSSQSTNAYANADLKFIGGKVGINLPGANIPQQNLDVNGTAAFSSLASSGLRMVTASSNGILGISPMPVLVETDPIYTGQEPSIVRYRGNINSGDDLNTYYALGIWACNAATTPTILNLPSGAPAGSPILLQVSGTSSSSGGYTTQVLTTQVSGAAGSGYRWVRNSDNSGTWAPWKKVITDGSNVSLLNNDAGYITSAAIPAPQALSLNNFSLSISSGNTITLPFTPYLITAQTNLNGISATNTALSISSAATNSPVSGVGGFGFSSWGGATGVQLALMNNNGAYIRTNSSLTSYTAWVKLATLNDIPIVNDATLTLQTSGIATGGAVAFTANSATAKTFTVNVPATNITASLNATTHVLSINSSTGTDATVDLTPLVNGQLLSSGGGWQLKNQGTGKQTVGTNALDFIIYDSAYTGNIGVTGEASVAFGKGNFVSGDRSASFGSENTSTGSRSFSLGLSSDAIGDGSFAHGQGTTVNGAWAAGFGISHVDGNYAFAAGNGNYAPSYSEVSVGIWGTNYTPASATAVNANDRIFNIGNGTSSAARKDALTVYKSGIVKISALAGSGSRMVTVDANGNLSTQAITAGTVTSVGMTVGGAALNVTPATIASSGTFALTWAGTNAQYVNGQGDLVTFPAIPSPYTLPAASASVLGGIKVGNRLSIASGVLSADNMIQNLSVSGQTLSISGGNSVTLPFGDYALKNGTNATGTWNNASKTVLNTNLGATGAIATTNLVTSTDWYLPVGWSGMLGSNTVGLPSTVGSYPYFFMLNHRNTNTGWGGLLYDYGIGQVGRVYLGTASTNTSFPQWAQLAQITDIPTNNNQLTNGAGYISSIPDLQAVTSVGAITSTPIIVTSTSAVPGFSMLTMSNTSNGGYLALQNRTTNNSEFTPFIFSKSAGQTDYGTGFIMTGSDVGWNYGFMISARNAAGTGAVTGGNLLTVDNNGTQRLKVGYDGLITLSSLSGTGNRMVIANASGALSTQAIPPNTTYTAGNGLTLTGTAFSLPVTVSGSGNYVSNVAQNANGITVTKATLPTIGNGTLTIQQNGSTVGTFTANQSANTTINLTGGGNEVVGNGYGYGRSNNFGSGWDAAGGFAANSIYITTNTPYQVSENDYTVYLFASGASVILPDPTDYPNRMIRLINATKTEIKAPQQYAIKNYDGNSLVNMGTGSYLIQSIRGAGGAWLWYLVGGNS